MTRKLLNLTCLSAVLLVIMAATSSPAAWKPVGPEPGSHRVRLVATAGAVADETLPGIWTVLETGAPFVVQLTGTGRIRLQSRPFYGTDDEEDVFRFAVDLGDTVRRFARRSTWAGTFVVRDAGRGTPAGAPETVGLGEVDVLDLEWGAGTASLTVTSRETDRRLLVRVLIADGVAVHGRAREAAASDDRRFSLDIEMPQIGWDSNAYVTAKSDSGRDGKWFVPVDLGAKWHGRAGTRTDLEASYAFTASLYDQPILDERRHRIRLVSDIRLGSQRPRQGIDLLLAYRFTHKNDTYNGRGDREEFETIDTSTGNVVSLANRFDYNEHRILAGLARNLHRRVRAFATVTGRMKDYVHDYAAYADIYSLDQEHLELEVIVDWRPHRAWQLTGEFRLRSRDYDEKFSRDADGVQVRTVPTSLHDTYLVAKADYGRGPGLRLDGELKWFRSDDQYAGYWDYSGTAVEGGAGWRWTRGHRAELSVRYSAKDYDRARVDYDPAGILRVKNILNIRVSGDYVVSSNWDVRGSFHYKDNDNNSAAFAYERVLVTGGLRFRY